VIILIFCLLQTALAIGTLKARYAALMNKMLKRVLLQRSLQLTSIYWRVTGREELFNIVSRTPLFE